MTAGESPDSQDTNLELVFELGKDSANELSKSSGEIDSKLFAFVGIGSVVVSLAAASESLVLGWPMTGRAILFVVGLAAYSLVLVVSAIGYWPRPWHGVRSPKKLREYVGIAETQAKQELLEHAESDFKQNYEQLTQKSRMLYAAAGCFIVELSAVLTWAIWEAVIRTAPAT